MQPSLFGSETPTVKPPTLKSLKETPATRIALNGAAGVSALELVSAILGNPDTALALLNVYPTITALVCAPWDDLASIPGMGKAKVAALKAAFEIGHRIAFDTDKPYITSPADAFNMLADMSTLEQEQMRVVLLDTRNRVVKINTIYQGSTNTTMVRVGELFREAIRANAVAIIVAHNHPSGDPSPSPEDVAITKDITTAGKLVSIDVLDHLVIGQGRFVSLKERGLGF